MFVLYIVGYQNKTVNDASAGGFTYCVETLGGVNVELGNVTLDSFKVVSPDGGLAGATSLNLTTFDAAGQRSGNYYYLDENTCGDYSVGPGWYDAQSIDDWNPIATGTDKIPFGTGVQIQSDCGATITFAGEVISEDLTFTINDSAAGGFTYTGNSSPVDVTLADLAISSPEGGLAGATSVNLTTFDAAGQRAGNYYYLDENTCGDYSVGPGWYDAQSIDDWNPIATGTDVIESGRMFQIQSDCGASITIPSALK